MEHDNGNKYQRDFMKAVTQLFEQSTTKVTDIIDFEEISDRVEITDGIYEDSGLYEWSQRQCTTQGGKAYLWHLLANPTFDVAALNKRRQAIISMGNKHARIQELLNKLRDCEQDLLWILRIQDFQKSWPLTHLFPSLWMFKYINYNPYMLDGYHLYKILLSPTVNIASPIVTLFAPWLYLKKSMHIPMTLSSYLQFLWMALKMAGKAALKDIRLYLTKIISVFIYVFFYFYGIVQSIQYASMLYKLRTNLLEKAESISQFVATFQELNHLTLNLPSVITRVHANVSSVYIFMTHYEKRQHLLQMLKDVYKIDAYFVATKLLYRQRKQFSVPCYTDDLTRLYGMGHIHLDREVTNPCSLEKNLVITGPNAAGKTTYTKALCSNIILAQSLGIVKALKAFIAPVHAIGSFMRVTDVVGQKSLFEAEVRRCSEICSQAAAISAAGSRAIYFLDEPMHSTPPIEGTATSFAVLEYLGQLPGIRVVLTTHYHELRILETESPHLFKNISMEARKTVSGFVFPYRIRTGHSMQSIALELLTENELAPQITQRAIEIKNKLCK